MIYPKDFEQLIRSTNAPDFIGWGNPNAKILLLGKEPAIDLGKEGGRIQYETEVKHNRADWSENIAQQTGFDDVVAQWGIYGNPLCPHGWQKYRVTNLDKDGNYPEGKEGTARTWYQYQKLTDMIFGKTLGRDDFLDFHKYCFSTDMSDIAALESSRTEPEKTKTSIEERKRFFSHDFFKRFPIIIAAVSHYPKKYAGDIYFKDTFDVEWMQQKSDGTPGAWINVNEDAGTPRLLLHTCQFSASLSDEYFERIAALVRNFADEYNLNLAPDSSL